MTTIHHAVAKRAQKLGVILEDLGSEEAPAERFKAHWPKQNQVLFARSAKEVVDNMATVIMIKEQFRSFKTKINDAGQLSITVPKVGTYGPSFEFADLFAVAKKAWQEAQTEDDVEDTEEEGQLEEENEDGSVSGSVVKQKYRARYAEAGHAHTCGDWLASLLNERTTNKAGFNLELFAEICAMNGVDMSAYSTIRKPSDRGRFKMTGRNMIAKRVFDRGFVVLPDGEFKAPQDWIDAQRFVKSKGKPPIRTPEIKA